MLNLDNKINTAMYLNGLYSNNIEAIQPTIIMPQLLNIGFNQSII